MSFLASDLRYAWRSLRKSPGFALTTVLLLGLGIGATTALFSVADSVLLRPLPYAHPESLVVTLHNGDAPVSPADYFDYRQSARSFAAMGAAQVWSGTFTAQERRERVNGMQVSASMMHLLGVQPVLGRSFREDEEHGGAARVLLLSHRLWLEKFGGDRNVLGRVVAIDQIPYTVVGVMPAWFRFAPFWATRAAMWSPLDLDKRTDDRGGRSLRVFARLRDGVTQAQAQAEMDAIANRLAAQYPATNAKLGIRVVSLQEKVVRSVRPTLLALLGTVGFVLLMACATVSNLMLARALTRRRESALRVALGASRWALVRSVLIEISILCALGGAAGLLAGNWAVGLLTAALPANSIPRLTEVHFDETAIAFAAALTVVTALVAGLVPGLQTAAADVNEALKSGQRSVSQNAGSKKLKSWLITVEVALSLVLLAGAGLMSRTMMALQSVDAGFDPHHLLTMQVAVSGSPFDQPGRREGLYRELREKLAAVPGVEGVSAINHAPIGGDFWVVGFRVPGRPVSPAPDTRPSAAYRVVMPAYFRTMKIGVVQGRSIETQDTRASAPVVVINQTLARRHWPGENPLGKTMLVSLPGAAVPALRTIVGVVQDVRQNDWTSPIGDEMYLPYYQVPDALGLSYLTFVIRTQGDPSALMNTAQMAVTAFQKSLTVSEVSTMDRSISDELWAQRLATLLMGLFGGLAVSLAAIGIYGVISHSMRERTRELGIRLALGAKRGDLLGMAIREGASPVGVGVGFGLAASLLLTRYLRSLLYGVDPEDPVTFVAMIALLLAFCGAANLLGASRALRVDPAVALHTD